MISTEIKLESRDESKNRFLNAALHVIRVKGYSATRIEDICEAAGLTKGSFFYHFESKEALALDAADYWTEGSEALFASAPYRDQADPLDRLLAYVDFRKALLTGDLADFTCLAGTMVQEVYVTHPALREACNRILMFHVPKTDDASWGADLAGSPVVFNDQYVDAPDPETIFMVPVSSWSGSTPAPHHTGD